MFKELKPGQLLPTGGKWVEGPSETPKHTERLDNSNNFAVSEFFSSIYRVQISTAMYSEDVETGTEARVTFRANSLCALDYKLECGFISVQTESQEARREV